MNEWVAIALLGKPRGNRGEIAAISLSSDPARFERLGEVFLFSETAGSQPAVRVEEAWWHQEVLVFKFAGIDSISDAEKLAGREVRVPVSERIVLEPGAYFHSELVGCAVRDRATGNALGEVAFVRDCLLEMNDGTLIPFARQICVEIDVARRIILVELPEGLLELNKPGLI